MGSDIKRLIGDDGSLVKGTLGNTQLPSSGTTIPAGIYKIAAKGVQSAVLESTTFASGTTYICVSKAASASVIPVGVGELFTPTVALTAASGDTAYSTTTILGGLEVGQYYIAPQTVTVGTADKFYAVTTSKLADVKGASLNVSAEEVDVTVAGDRFKKYRRGKFDADGSCSFIFMKGTTDESDGIAHQFYDIHKIDFSGQVESTLRSDDPLLLILYLDDESNTSAAEQTYKLCTIFEATFFNFDYKGESSTAVATDSKFRLYGSADPVLYKVWEKVEA